MDDPPWKSWGFSPAGHSRLGTNSFSHIGKRSVAISRKLPSAMGSSKAPHSHLKYRAFARSLGIPFPSVQRRCPPPELLFLKRAFFLIPLSGMVHFPVTP